jgi:DNA modification methylase
MSNAQIEFPEEEKNEKEVVCLGLTFKNDNERREYFRNELRKKLPELKQYEGYPIGEDEDIINLSDPPYYTACPNPWINDFIEEWEKEKATIKNRIENFKVIKPYASDVSEGKNNPIYNAHSYHTKVPHPAIMRYILYYTQPGDIVYDGFAGTGMTGVAAQLCGNPDLETKEKIEKEFNELGLPKPNWGTRKAILSDLSPIASFISYNYNTPVDVEKFEKEATKIIEEVENELGWMYFTLIPNEKGYEENLINFTNKLKTIRTFEEAKEFFDTYSNYFGKINYTVYSDVFICPNCGQDIVFWDAAVDKESAKVKDEFNCKICNVLLTKRKLEKSWVTKYDRDLNKNIRQTKTVPVLVNFNSGNKRYEKEPDIFDIELINFIENLKIPYWYPTEELPNGYNTEQPKRSNGITHVHHFYTKKNLWFLSGFTTRFNDIYCSSILKFLISTINPRLSTKMSVYRLNTGKSNLTSGTLYVPSFSCEYNLFEPLINKNRLLKSILTGNKFNNLILSSISSATYYPFIKTETIDYIFIDPPFGSNIMYSELNSIAESWLKVKTNNKKEAIENNRQNKGFNEYQQLMYESFKEYYRVLKPGKWMTVEFSNTSAIIWNGIQIALQRAGFVVANVAALDKKQGSFKAVTSTTAVKQDLIISCYKPSKSFVNLTKNDIEISLWDFVREHLEHLPVVLVNTTNKKRVIERDPRILFDRMIAYFLVNNINIPTNAADFQAGLRQRFAERDGMFFTHEQAVEYDKLYFDVKDEQFKIVFDLIYSETDAILWLKERLMSKPQTYSDLMPDFRKANQVNRKGEYIAELQTILEENFIQNDDKTWRVPNVDEAKDREIMRNKSLLKEFERYKTELATSKNKKLNEVRVEVLRAGFMNCLEKFDYKTIIEISNAINENILNEDEKLLMYYDLAKERIE